MHNSELLQKLDKLLNAYSHQYDIARDVTVDGGFFPATATFYLRDENYIINKKHVLSAVENYDYENGTKAELSRFVQKALKNYFYKMTSYWQAMRTGFTKWISEE